MSPRAALADALLITMATPATWPLALAAFLLRGGILLVLLPIVVLPSPVSLGNVLGPALTTVVLGGVPVELAVVVALIVVAVVVWIVAGGLVAATVEAEAVDLVARQDDAGRATADDRLVGTTTAAGIALTVLAARLVAHAPTALALTWGSARLVTVAYRELTSPTDVASPIALRVLRGAPEVVLVVGILWMLGEIVGARAVRRIVLGGVGARRGLRDGLVATLRNPVLALVGFGVPAAGLVAILLPAAAAASGAWTGVRVAMASSVGPFGATLAVLLFVALWIVGLFLVAVTTAWRAAVWSIVEQDRSKRTTASEGPPPG